VKPHRLNADFEWRPPSGPFRRLTEDNVAAWNELGYFVLAGVLDLDMIAALTAAIDPFEDEMTALLRTQPGGRIFIADADAITFTVHLVTRCPAARSFVSSEVMADVAADLVGPDVRLYWDQAVYKKPESPKEFPWHQDNGYNFVEPQQYLTCWVPLVDATVENGCPWVVPGLHRLGTLEHWWTDPGWQCVDDPPDAVPVEAEAGSIVVFSSLTPHRTGPNLSSAVRKAYIVQYAPDGAESVRADESGELVRQRHDDPARQFFVVRSGEVSGPNP
jgi:ectoine hydroxylase-related dioxygenase (phytanoyl-CoA dioxygenase family)